jgi:hypothetical protein
MTEIRFIVLALVFIACVTFALTLVSRYLKKQLTPLLPIVEGQTYVKFGRAAVLEGTWQGKKVEVEIKQYKCGANLFITLFGPCPLPFSLKIRPTSDVLALFDMPMSALADGHRFKIREADITVYSSAGNETMIRQFLNSDRLWVIENIFSHNLNYLEIHKDPTAGDYLKVGIEGCRLFDPGWACKTILKPKEVDYILSKLMKFYTASQHPCPELSASLSGA